MAAAMAHPTAWGYCVARLPEMVNSRSLALWYITGSCRPRHMSLLLDSSWHIMSTSGMPRVMCSPWFRYEGKSMSVGRNAIAAATDTASSP